MRQGLIRHKRQQFQLPEEAIWIDTSADKPSDGACGKHGTNKTIRPIEKFIQPLIIVSSGATENAGVENAAPDCRGGKRRSLKSMESEDFKMVFLTGDGTEETVPGTNCS